MIRPHWSRVLFTMICKHCESNIPLRSFRPPPNKCVHCGQLQDPHLPRSNRGCFVLAPIALVFPILCGWIGRKVGLQIAALIPGIPIDVMLPFLAAFDALAFVCLIHVKRFRGSEAQSHAGVVAIVIMYLAIGAKSAKGLGVSVMLGVAVANSLFASTMSFAILSHVK